MAPLLSVWPSSPSLSSYSPRHSPLRVRPAAKTPEHPSPVRSQSVAGWIHKPYSLRAYITRKSSREQDFSATGGWKDSPMPEVEYIELHCEVLVARGSSVSAPGVFNRDAADQGSAMIMNLSLSLLSLLQHSPTLFTHCVYATSRTPNTIDTNLR